MKTVKELDGRLWREPILDVWNTTLFGKQLKTFVCRTCKEKAYVSEAYKCSTRKSGYRPYHASCWNKYNGKSFSRLFETPKEPEPVATLDYFI
jgi:hypothetical protein